MSELEIAREYARTIAEEVFMEAEVMENFERYIAAGDDPWQAANRALYDWGI